MCAIGLSRSIRHFSWTTQHVVFSSSELVSELYFSSICCFLCSCHICYWCLYHFLVQPELHSWPAWITLLSFHKLCLCVSALLLHT